MIRDETTTTIVQSGYALPGVQRETFTVRSAVCVCACKGTIDANARTSPARLIGGRPLTRLIYTRLPSTRTATARPPSNTAYVRLDTVSALRPFPAAVAPAFGRARLADIQASVRGDPPEGTYRCCRRAHRFFFTHDARFVSSLRRLLLLPPSLRPPPLSLLSSPLVTTCATTSCKPFIGGF